jgi:epimerase transport system membrane fusion protein
VLVKLSEIQTRAQLDTLRDQLQEKLAEFARLQAERDNQNEVIFSDEVVDEKAKRDQLNIFESTKKRRANEVILTKQRTLQAQSQIKGSQSLLESKKERMASNSEEIKEWSTLYEQRLVDKSRTRELERENALLSGEIASYESDIIRLEEQINELRSQQELRDKEFMDETLRRYVDTKSIISELRSRIDANEDVLKRSSIVAPIDGVVVGMSMHTIGGVISSGQKILDIVSQDTDLYVVAQVQITDIDKVKNGLIADLRFSAFDLKLTKVIEGEVFHVSADSFIDEKNGAHYYQAKIRMTPQGAEQAREHGFNLVAGMPAEVMIKTGERTVLSYIVKPFADMLSRGFNEE